LVLVEVKHFSYKKQKGAPKPRGGTPSTPYSEKWHDTKWPSSNSCRGGGVWLQISLA
jgi:hypothetical protein